MTYIGKWFNVEALKIKGGQLETGLALVLCDFMSFPGMAVEVSPEGDVLMTMQVENDISVISEIQEVKSSNPSQRILYTGSSGSTLGQIVLQS